jgi:release factor glutamine methyltransferase
LTTLAVARQLTQQPNPSDDSQSVTTTVDALSADMNNSADAHVKIAPQISQIISATVTAISPPQEPTQKRSVSILQKIVWRLMSATTVGRAINSAKQRLDDADCSTAYLDAQVILAYVLNVDRSWLFAHHDYKLTSEQATMYTDLIVRRMNHEPVAYLVGRKEFYGLEFVVDRRVLIPRPETELLVDAVLDQIDLRDHVPLRIADVGTGSGAIALSIAANEPNAILYAIDVSTDALEVARSNAQCLDERKQVTLLHGDLLTPLPERVDIIVANLPYISSPVYPTLDSDVRDYEPQLALVAGPEGLDAMARLLRQAPQYLHANGVIYLEIGYDQGAAVLALVKSLLPQNRGVTLRQDYSGRDRLVTIEM